MDYAEALAYLDDHASYDKTGRIESPTLDRMRRIVRLQGLRAGADEFDAHSLDLTLTSLGAAPPRIG